jgi:hypothetical protein
VCRNTYLTFIDEMNDVPQRVAHVSIIEKAARCVNELTAAPHCLQGKA